MLKKWFYRSTVPNNILVPFYHFRKHLVFLKIISNKFEIIMLLHIPKKENSRNIFNVNVEIQQQMMVDNIKNIRRNKKLCSLKPLNLFRQFCPPNTILTNWGGGCCNISNNYFFKRIYLYYFIKFIIIIIILHHTSK